MSLSSATRSSEKILFWVLVLIGMAIHIYAASRTWIGGDQAHLLRLGAKLASEGEVIPFGKLLTGGGTNPGILLQLFFGVPMFLLEHFRSPMLLVILFHTIAFMLISRVLGDIVGSAILLPLVLVYWLTPWRIYYGSLLWEPAFIYLPAALHFWSSYRLREKRSFVASIFCIASIVWAMQIHNSFVILVFATLVLLWKKQIHIDLRGALVGFCIAGATLFPSILAVIGGDLHYDTQQSQGFIGKGLVTVLPMFKGVLYWFNLGGVEAVRNLKETRFAGLPGIYILQGLCILTVGMSIVASWWYFLPMGKNKKVTEQQFSPASRWLRTYVLATMVGLVIAAALSPLTLQGWMVVIALHAACIPVAIWMAQQWSAKRSSPMVLSCFILYAVFEVTVMLTIVLGQPIFDRQSNLPTDIDPAADQELLRYIPPLK